MLFAIKFAGMSKFYNFAPG